MRVLICCAVALVSLVSITDALVGEASVATTMGTPPVDGHMVLPFDTGLPGPPVLPPTFTTTPPGPRWIPVNGPAQPLGSTEYPVITISDGGSTHHWTILRHPTIPNVSLITYHHDLNGDGTVDPGETVIVTTVNN